MPPAGPGTGLSSMSTAPEARPSPTWCCAAHKDEKGDRMRKLFLLLAALLMGPALAQPAPSYFSRAGHADAWSGGVRMIPIHTPHGDFHVWTKRVGNNPRLSVLLLHG